MPESQPLPDPPTTSDRTLNDKPPFRILLVEDHAYSRTVMANLLRHCGYSISVAECAGDALETLNAKQFDLILSDIGLPDGSGNGLVMLAKQRYPSIMAIALSAFSGEEEIRFSREMGFDFYLTKPVDFHELRTVLKKCADPQADTQSTMDGTPVAA